MELSSLPQLERIWSRIDASWIVEILRDLVRVPSVNPPGETSEVVEVLRRSLEEVGFHGFQQVEPSPGKVSLVARWGSPGGRRLIWNGHLDVVPAGDAEAWRHAPFSGEQEGDRIFGRGACDMKGAFAALLGAVAAIQKAGFQLEGELVLQAVADEEMLGPLGTGYLVEHLPMEADAAICGEPTGLAPVIAAKGLQWWKFVARGRSCHASAPHLGVNAVEKLLDFLGALRQIPLPQTHHLVGRPTLAITVISGGIKTNVIPDYAEATADRRIVPGEDPEEFRRRVFALVEEFHARDPDVRVEAAVVQEAEPSEIPADLPIVQVCQRVAGAVLGQEVHPAGIPGTTDARFLINRAGIPTVILGPGGLEQAHTRDEYISLDQLVQGTKVYAGVLCEFLGVRG